MADVETDVVRQPKKRTFKKFSYRGTDLDALLDMSTDELVKLCPEKVVEILKMICFIILLSSDPNCWFRIGCLIGCWFRVGCLKVANFWIRTRSRFMLIDLWMRKQIGSEILTFAGVKKGDEVQI